MEFAPRLSKPPVSITPDAVERELLELFATSLDSGLVIRVQGVDDDAQARHDAFQELLSSLSIYNEQYRAEKEITVAPPDEATIAKAISVLARPSLQRPLFERVLWTFGQGIIDPLGAIIDAGPDGALYERMRKIRRTLVAQIDELRLTHETRQILVGDLERLLTDDYLTMLAEHEEQIQRPRVEALAREALHLIGTTFQHAFRSWPDHAQVIARSVQRRIGQRVALRHHPVTIRERIIEGIEEFLWTETSLELAGSLAQLYAQQQYRGLLERQRPELGRALYHDFATACWELVADNC